MAALLNLCIIVQTQKANSPSIFQILSKMINKISPYGVMLIL